MTEYLYSIIQYNLLFCEWWQLVYPETGGQLFAAPLVASSAIHFSPACATSGSRTSYLYVWEFIFAPLGTKIRFVREFADTPAQTIRERGFWTLSMYLMLAGMSWPRAAGSFWRLLASSTVNNFSSEKRIWSSVPGPNRVLSCLHLSSRLLRMDSLRLCTFFLLKDFIPRFLETMNMTDI